MVTIVRIEDRNKYTTARLMLNTPRCTQVSSLNSFWIWNVLFLWLVTPKMTPIRTRPRR